MNKNTLWKGLWIFLVFSWSWASDGDANTLLVAKEVLRAYKDNKLKAIETPGKPLQDGQEFQLNNLKKTLLNEVKRIYLSYKTYKFLIYNFPKDKWDKMTSCGLTYVVNSKNNGKFEDFFKLDGFIEEGNIGTYDYNKQYFSIFMEPDFFNHDYDLKKVNNDYDRAFPCFYIKYFNMNGLKQQVVFKFFPSIADDYKNILEYKGSERLFLKSKTRGKQLEALFLLTKSRVWDEPLMIKILSKLDFIYWGPWKNHEVYQIKTQDKNVIILMMVNVANNYVTFLMETRKPGTFSDSYFYIVIPNINDKNKYTL
jgi:hypothetical protein